MPGYQTACRDCSLKIDLHVHTIPLSPDSLMSAEEAIQTAREIGLDGICFTEHDRAWQPSEIRVLREKYEFPVFTGVEVMLQGGIEMLAFGLNVDFTSLLHLRELRRMVTAADGFMIYAHPFRGLPESTISDPDAAMRTALGKVDIAAIDAVEAHNGRHRETYNQPALQMAARHNLRTTGGSDAHSPDEIGTCVTVFETTVTTDGELLQELKAGRFSSAPFRFRERWSWQQAPKS
ncbi:MAG: PHP-associated domain-containing protein [Dehalococcoidia bacterium]|nr:PHP-associated domain-containing protein [Dehalococcoidia bacterium]